LWTLRLILSTLNPTVESTPTLFIRNLINRVVSVGQNVWQHDNALGLVEFEDETVEEYYGLWFPKIRRYLSTVIIRK
jgi:hypothetical protein